MDEEKKRITMAENLDSVLRELLSKNRTIRDFENSMKEFQSLIESGITKPQGYNLHSIEPRVIIFNRTTK